MTEKDHLGDWSPEKDCCLWLTFQQHLTLKMASAQVVEAFVTNKNPSQDSNHPDDLFQSRNNSKTKYNNPLSGHHHCQKKENCYMAEYTALSFLIEVRPHFLLKVNFVKRPPQFLAITYQMRQYMYWLWMTLSVAVRFAYKWLHNFVKALDEIKKKCKLIWCLLLAV